MRLGVLDIGSNTGHLLVVDAHRGAAPLPASSFKEPLLLSERIDDTGAVDETGVQLLVDYVQRAQALAVDKGCEDVLAFATSAIRESQNGKRVLAQVREQTGLKLRTLAGHDEARLTFLAVRRWFGWSSGRLVVFDIGGGSLEIAAGPDERPQVAQSLPLGAARLTRDRLRSAPPTSDEVTALRTYVRTEMARIAGEVLRPGPLDHAVATSKTFRSLARICGAEPSAAGPLVRRSLRRADLSERLPELVTLSPDRLAELPGVSSNRAHQMVAGAVLADAVMDVFGIDELTMCPWALREGVILERLDQM